MTGAFVRSRREQAAADARPDAARDRSCADLGTSGNGVHRLCENDKGCNVRLKGLKTLSDQQRKLVNLHPRNTTIPAINALAQPHPTPRTRSTAFSSQVWKVSAQIVEFKPEGDSDIHLVLFGDGAYLIAEMRASQCLPKKTRDRKAIVAVREKFEANCGKPTIRQFADIRFKLLAFDRMQPRLHLFHSLVAYSTAAVIADKG